MENGSIREIIQRERICVIIPSYGNEKTVAQVVSNVYNYTHQVIVVLDGEPKDSLTALHEINPLPTIVAYEQNRGKGHALQEGFKKASAMNYLYAITLDADGQHAASDIPYFIENFIQHKGAFLVGVRNFNHENMPERSSWANRFSNFWFRLQTGISLTDTQCGYRLYPLKLINKRWPITSRYEAELEFLVYAAWQELALVAVPINVYYPKQEERVSHFRPFWDFFRITVLNTVLTTVAFCYFIPKRLLKKLL